MVDDVDEWRDGGILHGGIGSHPFLASPGRAFAHNDRRLVHIATLGRLIGSME